MPTLKLLDQVLLQPNGLLQIFVFLGCVLLAFGIRFVLSLRLRVWRDRTQHKLGASLLDGAIFLLPLLTPILALLFTGMGQNALQEDMMPTQLFPTGYKLLMSWLIIEAIWRFATNIGSRIFLVSTAALMLVLDMLDVLGSTIAWMRKLSYQLGGITISLYGIFSAVIALIILLWVARLFDTGMDRILARVQMRGSTRQLVTKTINVILYAVVGMTALSILGVDITTLTVFSGAVGVGIGFGLQKIASNFISGIILLMEKSIEVNDMIIMENGATGRIRQTGARYTLVDTEDGRAHMIPNEQFITQKVVNLTHMGKRGKVELRFYVAYEADLRLVRSLILAQIDADPRPLKDPAPSCHVATLREGFVEVASYFWLPDITKGRSATITDLYLVILDDFRLNHIAIPTPFLTRYLGNDGSYMPQAPIIQPENNDLMDDMPGDDTNTTSEATEN